MDQVMIFVLFHQKLETKFILYFMNFTKAQNIHFRRGNKQYIYFFSPKEANFGQKIKLHAVVIDLPGHLGGLWPYERPG